MSTDDIPEEIRRLRQGLWDVFEILGGDQDGDKTPDALTSDIVALVVETARDLRESYDEASAYVPECVECGARPGQAHDPLCRQVNP